VSERSVGPLTLTDFVRFAGAVGDFNPMQHDDEHARRHGHPGVFGMGMFAAGLAGDVRLAHFGGSVRDWTARFVERVWPGEILTAELDDLASDDQVRFVVRSESGPKVTGHARIAEAGLSEIERATDDVDRSVDSPRSIAPVTSEMARNMIAESHGLPRSY
jgi:acyl dehydratase